MPNKKQLKKKVSNMEEKNCGKSAVDSIVEGLKENLAQFEEEGPSEIEIEDEEHSITELVHKVCMAMKIENKETRQKIEKIYKDLEKEDCFSKETLRERAKEESIAKNFVDGWLAEKNLLFDWQ